MNGNEDMGNQGNRGNRLSTITTRTGDDGTTGLADGSRLPKTDVRFQAMGDVDELNSWLGLILTESMPEALQRDLLIVQHDLFDIGAALCMPGIEVFKDSSVERLDAWIQQYNSHLPRLQEFILPGGSRIGAHLHLARTVARRAERAAWQTQLTGPVPQSVLLYLNRLSDFLFIAARWVHQELGFQDAMWQKNLNAPEQQKG